MKGDRTDGEEAVIQPIGILPIAAGLAILLFNDRMSREMLRGQSSFWGYHYDESERKRGRIVLVVVGCILIALGMVVFLGVIA